MAHTTVIYGGPGTGKTHRLLELLRKELETTPSDKIAYVSFTRKGTYQGVDIAKEQFDLTDEDVPYFATLHSIAYHLCSKDVLTNDTLGQFPQLRTVIETLGYTVQDFMQWLNSAQKDEVDPIQNATFAKVYAKLKTTMDKIDFNDLLDYVLENNLSVPVKVAFIDEAQDLTPQQWQVAETLFANAERWYVAGDPNQALFTSLGVDQTQFMSLPRDEEIFLEYSHRCSKAVMTIAKQMIQFAQYKIDVPPYCKDEEGWFSHVEGNGTQDIAENIANCIDDVLTLKGTKFVLCFSYYREQEYFDYLCEHGIPFLWKKNTDKLSIPVAVHRNLRDLYSFMRDRAQMRKYFNGGKGTFSRGFTDFTTKWKLDEVLLQWYRSKPDAHRAALYRKIELIVLQYCMRSILKYGEPDFKQEYEALLNSIKRPALHDVMRVKCAVTAFKSGYIAHNVDVCLSTVQRIKGDEADYVILDVGTAKRQRQEEDDTLFKVAYVGVTRAKTGILAVSRCGSRDRAFDFGDFTDINTIEGARYENYNSNF